MISVPFFNACVVYFSVALQQSVKDCEGTTWMKQYQKFTHHCRTDFTRVMALLSAQNTELAHSNGQTRKSVSSVQHHCSSSVVARRRISSLTFLSSSRGFALK